MTTTAVDAGWAPAVLDDVAVFAAAMLDSRDLDPAYPVLRYLGEQAAPGDEESRLWLTYLYLTYYNLTSALVAHQACPHPTVDLPPVLDELPTGTERRGLRGGKVRRHLHGYLSATSGGPAAYWKRALRRIEPLERGWELAGLCEAIPGNGRWASYKWGDLMRYVHDWPVDADGIDAKNASGPVDGLAVITGWPAAELRRDPSRAEALARRLQDELSARDVTTRIDQVETLLCDYKSLAKGQYYVGHDIDLMQAHTRAHPQAGPRVIQARRHALPRRYLGEENGWDGVDPARKRVYQATGRIVTR